MPQGSILGPILFLVYVSDMCVNLASDAHQFADDTTLIHTFRDPMLASNVINSDQEKLSRWAEQWWVTFNPDKTFFLHMSLKKKKPIINNLFFCNKIISESHNLTTLGLTICNNLNWDLHIENIILKASKRLLILKRYKRLLPRIALETIYTAMIRPILEYGHIIYDNCSASAAQAIEKIQHQSALVCTGAYKHTSYSKLLTELNWEPLSTRRQHFKLITYYNIVHNIYPRYLVDLLPDTPPTHYNLRDPQPLRPRASHLTMTYNSYFPSTTRA